MDDLVQPRMNLGLSGPQHMWAWSEWAKALDGLHYLGSGPRLVPRPTKTTRKKKEKKSQDLLTQKNLKKQKVL